MVCELKGRFNKYITSPLLDFSVPATYRVKDWEIWEDVSGDLSREEAEKLEDELNEKDKAR